MLFLNSKNIGKSAMIVFLFALIFLPSFTYSEESPDSKNKKTGIVYECAKEVDGKLVYGDCDFNDLLSAVKKVVDFGTTIALSLSVIVIAWAGFKYMTSGSNPGERAKANEMLLKVVYGIAFILTAWLIVTLITNALLTEDIKKIVPLK